MANHASAIKRHRQSLRRQTRNRWWKSRVRTVAKNVQEAVTKKDKTLAAENLQTAMKEISKAKTNGAIHANAASRKIARLSKLVAKL